MDQTIHILLNIITYVLTAGIIITAIIFRRYIKKQRDANLLQAKRHWIEQLPSLVSTLGVLGTFFGITVGLIFFDTSDLDNSIPLLLSGLQTAFFTSLAGMGGSIAVGRRVNTYYDKEDSKQKQSDISIASDKIVQAIEYLKRQQVASDYKAVNRNEALNRIAETLVEINKSTVGVGDKLENMKQTLSLISNGIDQIKDDVEEIKGHGEAVDNQQALLSRIDNTSKDIKSEISRLLAVSLTATASISKLDTTITDKVNSSNEEDKE